MKRIFRMAIIFIICLSTGLWYQSKIMFVKANPFSDFFQSVADTVFDSLTNSVTNGIDTVINSTVDGVTDLVTDSVTNFIGGDSDDDYIVDINDDYIVDYSDDHIVDYSDDYNRNYSDAYDYNYNYTNIVYNYGSGYSNGNESLMHALGENPQKHLFLFGTENKRCFTSQEEAFASMSIVTVPVWILYNGQKVSSTATFTIHTKLIPDIIAIFTEIYNDPERFPIGNISGYNWSADNVIGEHSCGTAIDINFNENYQVYNGKIMSGSLWQPGVNPFSILPDGSVVRIFKKYGWSWGGDAWSTDVNENFGYHDYMHFSYMGR